MCLAAILFCDAAHLNKVSSCQHPFNRNPYVKSIDQVVLEKKTFKDFMVVYLYIAQGQGQIIPGQNFDPY